MQFMKMVAITCSISPEEFCCAKMLPITVLPICLGSILVLGLMLMLQLRLLSVMLTQATIWQAVQAIFLASSCLPVVAVSGPTC